MSDPNTKLLIDGAFYLLGLLVVGYVGRSMERLRHDQARQTEEAKRDRDAAVVEVEEVKQTAVKVADRLEISTAQQAEAMDGLAKVTAATHEFLNSKEGAKLRRMAAMSRKVADLTKDPADVREAEMDEILLREHQDSQLRVDAQPGTDAQKQGKG